MEEKSQKKNINTFHLETDNNSEIYKQFRKLRILKFRNKCCFIKNHQKFINHFNCSYWDINFDSELMNDPIALNLLYVQTVAELEKGWIICTRDTRLHLTNLQAKLAKKDYIRFAATLKYYGYTQFAPCFCDYPNPRTRVLIAIGDHELNMRIIDSGQHFKEGCFKVTRMRCWRITATHVSQLP